MTAVPPPYLRKSSFSDFSTESAPTVGQNLDAEFNAVRASLTSTQSRLAQIQRDDGFLANDSVHPDALSAAVRVMLAATGEVKGTWATGIVYDKADVVAGPDGVTYLSAADHVGGASFAADLALGRWLAIDSGRVRDFALRDDLASATAGLGAALLGWPAGFGIDQPATNKHFTQNGAGIHRLNDRVLIGGATANDGAFPNVGRDWMSDYWVSGGFAAGPMVSAVAGIANNTDPNSAIGHVSAVRTLNFASAGTTAIGGFSFVLNNHATLATKAYGHYIEAHRTTASPADTFGLEIDTLTMKDTIAANPYQIGDVVGLQLASGAEWSATGQFDASAAAQIAANPKKFKRGIVFGATALTGCDGVTGVAEAMSLAKGHYFQWWAGASVPTSLIYSTATATAGAVNLELTQGQVNINARGSGKLQHAFVIDESAANYFAFYSALAGSGVRILAGGSDTNVNISIEPKGLGNVVIPIDRMRNFANDAAAAAATPAVPVGGLYRNGSVVQIRVS